MIQRIHTVSFGASPVGDVKSKIKEAQEKKDEIIDGTLGAGGAVVAANVAKGRTAMKAFSGVSQKASKIVSQVPKNTNKFQKFFLDLFEAKLFKALKNVKCLGWIGKLAKSHAVVGFGKVFGAFAAVGLCATNLSNMINTSSKIFDGEKFPILDTFGK